jgi:hypothetical protein
VSCTRNLSFKIKLAFYKSKRSEIYLREIDLAYDLDIDGRFWLDDSLVGSHDIIDGLCSLHLKENVRLRAFVDNID